MVISKDRILVGICSCGINSHKRRAIRESWLSKPVTGITVLFFTGRVDGCLVDEPDTVYLDAPDSYDDLPAKVLAFFCFALNSYDFDWLFKCDDDTYVSLDRLHDLIREDRDLSGNDFLRTKGYPSGGAGYLMSRDMVEKLAMDDTIPKTGCEDVLFGSAAIRHGARTFPTRRLCHNLSRWPRRDNDIISCHWCPPLTLLAIHGNLHGMPEAELIANEESTDSRIILRDNSFFEWEPSRGCGRWEKCANGGIQLHLPEAPPLLLEAIADGYSGAGTTFAINRPSLPRTLVFSSVGDDSEAPLSWMGGAHHVALVHYGESAGSALLQTLQRRADHFARNKGGKFQNLVWWLDRNPDILNRYDRILVIDDDTQLDPVALGQLLEEAITYNLPVCAPSQRAAGKISWQHMAWQPGARVTFTNFVEMNCVLFDKNALSQFIKEFRPHASRLTGWGTDFIISSACFDECHPFGVVHSVSILNPIRRDEKGIESLETAAIRSRKWQEISQNFKIRHGSQIRSWSIHEKMLK